MLVSMTVLSSEPVLNLNPITNLHSISSRSQSAIARSRSRSGTSYDSADHHSLNAGRRSSSLRLRMSLSEGDMHINTNAEGLNPSYTNFRHR